MISKKQSDDHRSLQIDRVETIKAQWASSCSATHWAWSWSHRLTIKARSRSHHKLKLGLHFQKDQSLIESFSVLNLKLNPLRRQNAIKITNTIIRVHSNQDLRGESWTTPRSTHSSTRFIRVSPKSTNSKVLMSSPTTQISCRLIKDNITGNWDKRTCHSKPANRSMEAVNLR